MGRTAPRASRAAWVCVQAARSHVCTHAHTCAHVHTDKRKTGVTCRSPSQEGSACALRPRLTRRGFPVQAAGGSHVLSRSL